MGGDIVGQNLYTGAEAHDMKPSATGEPMKSDELFCADDQSGLV
jgi:hypothetical protein